MKIDFVPATMDAQIWAREFCKRFPEMDEGTMIGWFANAIMAGFDEAQRRAETAIEYEPRVGTPERVAWQQAKNAEASRLVEAIPLAKPIGVTDAST